MPYASEALRRAHKRASASHACESAKAEIDRVVARIHRDMPSIHEAVRAEGRAFRKIAAGLEDAIAFAKGDTSRGRLIEPGHSSSHAG